MDGSQYSVSQLTDYYSPLRYSGLKRTASYAIGQTIPPPVPSQFLKYQVFLHILNKKSIMVSNTNNSVIDIMTVGTIVLE